LASNVNDYQPESPAEAIYTKSRVFRIQKQKGEISSRLCSLPKQRRTTTSLAIKSMENSIQSYHLTANNQVHPGPLSHSGPLKPEHRSGGKTSGGTPVGVTQRSFLGGTHFGPYSRFWAAASAALHAQAARQ
jgi:hypothetical protein